MSERNFIDIKIFMLTNKTDLFFFKQEWFEYLLIMTRVEYPFSLFKVRVHQIFILDIWLRPTSVSVYI